MGPGMLLGIGSVAEVVPLERKRQLGQHPLQRHAILIALQHQAQRIVALHHPRDGRLPGLQIDHAIQH
jgi:hypothetical protein